ncbi:cuticle protein CP14.6-like isoform X2 [Penaeus monodon]|nr:cuticle protein CP14.6-like isoform X2 [Penaeus monodon]
MNNDLRNDSGTLFVVMALLTALASATPSPEPQRDDSLENGAILRDDHLLDDRLLDDRLADDYDRFNFGVEPTNGIFLSESGFGELKNVFRGAGSFSYTAPDGTPIYVEFVVDENGRGFQTHQSLLPPKSPFPRPIPKFVLDQITKAAEEGEASRTHHHLKDPNLPVGTS